MAKRPTTESRDGSVALQAQHSRVTEYCIIVTAGNMAVHCPPHSSYRYCYTNGKTLCELPHVIYLVPGTTQGSTCDTGGAVNKYPVGTELRAAMITASLKPCLATMRTMLHSCIMRTTVTTTPCSFSAARGLSTTQVGSVSSRAMRAELADLLEIRHQVKGGMSSPGLGSSQLLRGGVQRANEGGHES